MVSFSPQLQGPILVYLVISYDEGIRVCINKKIWWSFK